MLGAGNRGDSRQKHPSKSRECFWKSVVEAPGVEPVDQPKPTEPGIRKKVEKIGYSCCRWHDSELLILLAFRWNIFCILHKTIQRLRGRKSSMRKLELGKRSSLAPHNFCLLIILGLSITGHGWATEKKPLLKSGAPFSLNKFHPANIFKIVREKLCGQVKDGKLSFRVINESHPLNVLSGNSIPLTCGPSVYSNQGFAESPERQAEIANFIMQQFGIKEKGPFLDVGFGGNIHIANAFGIAGIPSFAIDLMAGSLAGGESLHQPPKFVRKNEEGVAILQGDIAQIGEKHSALKKQKFGLIYFGGSWASGGNNWTVGGEMAEAKFRNLGMKGTSTEFVSNEQTKILNVCKKHLTGNGLIGVVSSRYAFHGAGWDFRSLPEEKLSFVELVFRLKEQGAKEICLVGISQKRFDELLTDSQKIQDGKQTIWPLKADEISKIRSHLRTVSALPSEDAVSQFGDDPTYRKNELHEVINSLKDVQALNDLARIDAIFASF